MTRYKTRPAYTMQLAAWWHHAEQGVAKSGDLVIVHNDDEHPGYEVYTIGKDQPCAVSYLRILHRAPKPTPAWHDSRAVIADAPDGGKAVYSRDSDWYWWNPFEPSVRYHADELHGVTPLIEARVTDEMVVRSQIEIMRLGLGDFSPVTLASIITAALGLDPA